MIAKILRLKRKLEVEVMKNKRTRLFTYMIIHDIKHPTESLINSLNDILTRVKDYVIVMEKLQKSNESLKKILKSICAHNGFTLNENPLRLNLQQSSPW